VQALLDLGLDVHLVTSSEDAVPGDPRFASTTTLAEGLDHGEITGIVTETARRLGTVSITFNELDIVIVGQANERLGVSWARPEADRIGRDKRRQREFLYENGIPSIWHCPVHDVGTAVAAARDHGFPVIVKPTRAGSSIGVQLVEDEAGLGAALASVRGLASAGVSGFADDASGAWALVEEFIPGREVTLDGVALDGQFFLGGIHDKLLTKGPFFEEDLYTLPFSASEREPELVAIATQIVKCLGLDLALFNAELREDAHGSFRVVEFSTRISGGHVYRNIRDVYGIDLVKTFVKAACCGGGAPPAERLAPRMATCAKLLYANGRVKRNSTGNAIFSPSFRAYYPMARPGQVIACAPRGFDILGALSVWLPWRPGQTPSQAHRVAAEVAAELDVVVSAD
jgi:hypothetical protein